MHKFDFYIQDFLLSHETFSAENIGEFRLTKRQEINGAPVVHFTYNKHAGTTQELVAYIAEKERKNKVVTGFDIEAHFNEVRQFMNTGKAWVLPGIGQVQMNMSREYELVQQPQEEAATIERKRVMQTSQPGNEYGLQRNEPRNSNRTGAILLTLIVIAALGFAAYYFYADKQIGAAQSAERKDTAATQTDTMVNVPSSSNMNNTTAAATPPAVQDTKADTAAAVESNNTGLANVRFVIERTASQAYADKRFRQLKSFGIAVAMDSVARDTSTLYKIYIDKAMMPADTAKTKDSLAVYFGKPVRIESGGK